MAGMAIEFQTERSESGQGQVSRLGDPDNALVVDPASSPLNFSFSFDERAKGLGAPKRAMDTALEEATSSLNESLGSLKSELVNQLKSGAGNLEEGETLAQSGMARGADPHQLGTRQAVSLGVSDSLVPEVAHRTWVRATAIASGASAEISGEAKKQEKIKGGRGEPGAQSPNSLAPSQSGAVPNSSGSDPSKDNKAAQAKQLIEQGEEIATGPNPNIETNKTEVEKPDLSDGRQGSKSIERSVEIEGSLPRDLGSALTGIEAGFGEETIRRLHPASLRLLREHDAFRDFDPTVALSPEHMANAMEAEAKRLGRLDELSREAHRLQLAA